MLPPSLAFAWLLWRQHGAGLLVVLGGLGIAAAVSAVLPARCSPDVARGIFGLVITVTLPLAAIGLLVFVYGADNGDLFGRESCFPIRLFTLPVRTGSLVVWPMAFGAAGAALMWLGAAWFILRPWVAVLDGHVVPLWWPALFLTACLAWFQALLWSPFGLTGLRFILLSALIPLGMALGGFSANSGVSEGWLVGLFGSLTVAAWPVSYIGVKHARRGDVPDWDAMLWPVRQLARWLPQRRAPFMSAARAQVWFEWRLAGPTLPIMVGMVLPFALLFLAFPRNDVISTAQTLLYALGVPVFVAGLSGAPTSGKNPWVKEYDYVLSKFTATLPMTTAALVGAKLKAAALSTLAAWGLMAVAVPLAVVLTGNLDEVVGWWRQGLHEYHPLQFVVGIAAAATVLLVWTWKRKVDSLFAVLTGRTWIVGSLIVVGFFGSTGLCVIAVWIGQHPETHETTLDVLPWILGLLVLCRLLLAAWALRQVLRRGLLAPPTVARWLAGWLLLASVLIGLLAWSVPPGFVPVYYLAFAVLFALPMARLAATPLALAWNRHR